MTTGGIDHNFVLSGAAEGPMHLAAILADPMTGRRLTILTTEPGLQVYTGNFLDGQITGKGVRYVRNSGIALETQHFPDSPNHSHFPSTILRPGAEYFSATTFRFDCHA